MQLILFMQAISRCFWMPCSKQFKFVITKYTSRHQNANSVSYSAQHYNLNKNIGVKLQKSSENFNNFPPSQYSIWNSIWNSIVMQNVEFWDLPDQTPIRCKSHEKFLAHFCYAQCTLFLLMFCLCLFVCFSCSDMVYCGVYDNALDNDNYNVARGFNYHQGPVRAVS